MANNKIDNIAEKAEEFFSTKLMHAIIFIMVILTAIFFGLDTIPYFEPYAPYFKIVDSIIVVTFIIELSVKIVLLKKRFFKNYWNVVDLIAVTASMIPSVYAYALRLLRVFHALSALEMVPKTKTIVDGLIHALPGVLNVLISMFVLFYMLALIATSLFGGHLPESFGTVLVSMFTLFKVVSGGEDWATLAKELSEIGVSSIIFFLSTLLIGYFLFALAMGAVISAVFRVEETIEPLKSTKDIQSELLSIRQDLQSLKKHLKIK